MTQSKQFVSPAEKEVCCRLAGGQRIKEIADAMKFHENMVDYHLRMLRRRFNAGTNIQLISVLQSAGLLA